MLKTAVIAAGLTLSCALPAQESNAIKRGEYLIHAGGCITCHTEDRDGAEPLAGGRELDSPYGIFYSPNITPDKTTGIGNWSDDEFVRAFHEGRNRDDDAYFPAFPYTAYTGLARADILDIKAYLFSLAPVVKKNKKHDLPLFMSTRLAASAWQKRYFRPARFTPDPARDAQWNRGAYLVRHLGHCGECHTPRKSLGALRQDRELAGNPDGPDDGKVPNITPHRSDGIGRWSLRDIEYFLEAGMEPDGDFSGGAMAPVIEDNTSMLTPDDRRAIATYLQALPPLADED
jgi:mono/diheme cytochrome c family protein